MSRGVAVWSFPDSSGYHLALDLSWRDSPVRWDAASSRVRCAVAQGSAVTKSEGMMDEMGVRHVKGAGWDEPSEGGTV